MPDYEDLLEQERETPTKEGIEIEEVHAVKEEPPYQLIISTEVPDNKEIA